MVIPPGKSAKAHRHIGSESAIYIIQGTVLTRYADTLQWSVRGPWGLSLIHI